ncbi:MAG: leucine-rich repeat protein [Oscillospiraceae bacterium]|nr:leucine-rich repeat protein [Oscillospiraceae bacterium]
MKMKKFGTICVCLTLLMVCLLFLPARAQEINSGTCGENLIWTLDDAGTLTISGTSEMNNWEWGKSPWHGNTDIKKVIVEDGVTNIGQYAFVKCTALETLVLGKDVAKIESYVFLDCTALKNVSLSDGIQEIGYPAFEDCENLVYQEYENAKYLGNSENPYVYLVAGIDPNGACTIHPNTKTIGYSAFRDFTMTEVVIPDGVKSLDQYAFMYCGKLTSVTIGAGVENIHADAFYGNGAIEGYQVAAGNAHFAADASGVLYNAAMTRLIRVPGKLTGDYVIPEGVTYIPDMAFYGSDITSLSIPDSIESVGFNIVDPYSSSIPFNIYDNAKYLGNAENPYVVLVKYTSQYITSIEIHKDTRIIQYEAFNGCHFTELVIPDKVVEIGCRAFRYCDEMTTLTLGSGVKYIRDSAFMLCSALKSINTSDSLEIIEDGAFAGCWELTGIHIPASLKKLGSEVFHNCHSMKNVTVDQNNPYYCMVGGIMYNKAKTEIAYVPTLLAGSVIVPAAVTTMNKGTFEDCSQLTDITILAPVTELVYATFSGCVSLQTVTLPASIQSIEKFAFAECTSLTDIYFGGTKEQWESLPVDYNNDILETVTVHYNSVPVIEAVPGDLNADYLVDTDDVIALLLYISMPDIFELPEGVNADFTGDGQVTTDDAITLLLHASMPDMFPLTNDKKA